ncbi:G-protein alpha subunit [Mycena metata]|uniref:G-protein alpha subunit n=1 Tax=Mycena metata TaxID=1033252 RepID=A0AAD7MI54_9AGAR|nr:G-protein alpha subunit [Mycena metata]
MGACASQPTTRLAAARQSASIDRQLLEDSKRYRKECKILLLGSGESGKSTIVKQMKIIHQDGYNEKELREWVGVVRRNAVESAWRVARVVREWGVEGELGKGEKGGGRWEGWEAEGDKGGGRGLVDRVLSVEIEGKSGNVESAGAGASGSTLVSREKGKDSDKGLTADAANAIEALWRDPVVAKVLEEHGSEFYLMDSAGYFLSAIHRLADSDYLPTEEDVLRARLQSTSITETRFTMAGFSIHMFDVGGQRGERRKWIHCFEGVTSIIFCTALSDYDQVLEEEGQTRMRESLVLFESVLNSPLFLRTAIILFLNKVDVFQEKLGRVPLERYFPEYTGGPDMNRAARFILWRFMQENVARLSVYPYLTQATDTNNVQLVFTTVKETILQGALKSSWIL